MYQTEFWRLRSHQRSIRRDVGSWWNVPPCSLFPELPALPPRIVAALDFMRMSSRRVELHKERTATRCNTLQHAAKQSTQHTAIHCTLQYTAPCVVVDLSSGYGVVYCCVWGAHIFEICCSIVQCVAVCYSSRCSMVQRIADCNTHCNTQLYARLLQQTHSPIVRQRALFFVSFIQVRCNTLQRHPTHCSPLQHTATHCHTLQRIPNDQVRDLWMRNRVCGFRWFVECCM